MGADEQWLSGDSTQTNLVSCLYIDRKGKITYGSKGE